MIPILYAANENTFTTYGIGALSDAVSCVVTEERNGQYELLMQYPITGKLYDELAAERIIKAKAHPIGDDQLFRIYRMSKPIRGIVSVYAQHISYDLSGIPVAPFTSSYTVTGAMAYLFTGTSFTGSSSISGSKTVSCTEPKSIRAMLGGTQGSLLDLWGGEYRWDNFTVYLNTNRGSDKGVVIEYGKNLTALVADHDLTEVYSELLPYATYADSAGTMHTVVGNAQAITSVITRQKTLIKDFTAILGLSSGTAPTVNQIDTAAQAWLSNNPLGYETPSLTVSFVEGEHGADYPASAGRIDLCDTITIRYTALGVDVKAKVVKSQYDTLLERYTELTVGKPRANMATTVATLSDEVTEVQTYPTRWNDAIALATQMITGNDGGYVILHEGPDGKPYELLIMDNPDINSAQNVWRWNLNGLGFSSSGYAGPYATAITANGMINADFIQTGELNADLIKAGALIIKDALNNIIFKADADNKLVNIANFSVKKDSFEYVSTDPSGYTGKNNETTIQVGNNGIVETRKVWDSSTKYTIRELGVAAANYDPQIYVSEDRINSTVTDKYITRTDVEPNGIVIHQTDANDIVKRLAQFALTSIYVQDNTANAPSMTYLDGLLRVDRANQQARFWVDSSHTEMTVQNQTKGVTVYPHGVMFDQNDVITPRMHVRQFLQESAGTAHITLESGIYLAITTHNNNSSSSQSGLAIIQCRASGTSSLLNITSASNSTLSVSSGTLTWTTTNTYRTLTLIYITG